MHGLDDRLPLFDDALASLPPPDQRPAGGDEAFWATVSTLYRTAPGNLENGYWGVMAEPVKAAFQHWTDRVNRENTLLMRRQGLEALEQVRANVAAALGCGTEEIALTRGATEAMLALISGYNRLRPGDTVLYCDLDYPAMRHAMEWLRERRGVQPVRFAIPEPATRQAVLDAYADMLQRHPTTRLVLLTHLGHGTGLVMPVQELAAMARAAGAEAIVDAAHSWGQLDFDVGSLGVPFAAFNLHKWIGAPLGCGCLYIRRDSLPAIDRYFGDQDFGLGDIRSRIHTGSPNFAAWLTIPAALQLHQRIGAAAKAARLRSLRDQWVQAVRGWPGIDVLTPDEPGMAAGITSFRLKGRTTAEDNDAVVARLQASHGIFTVRRSGPAAGDCVRVTPAVHTTRAEVARLVEGLEALCGPLAARS